MKVILDHIFPAPVSRKRARPDELLYALDEKPPLALTVMMGSQHAFLALIFTIYAVVAGQSLGLGAAAITAFVSATIFMLGATTLLQALPTRFGAGMILVAIPSAGRLPLYIAVTEHYGLGSTMGATIATGIAAIAFARIIPRLRPMFPPEVIGVVVLMLGLTLIASGMRRSVGLSPEGALSGAAIASALATIACMAGVSLWGPPWLRRLTMVVGVVAGTAVAALTGILGWAATTGPLETSWLAVPILGLQLPGPEFALVPIAIFMISQTVGIMDLFGNAISMDKMNDAAWRRVDMPLVARSVTAMGIAHVFQGALGLLASGASSANIGLANATGITARRVGIAAGLALMVAAFLPPVAQLIASTPPPVVGGVMIYTAAYLVVAGMDLAMSRMMNTRRSLTVGLAVVCGVSVMVLPELGRAAPEWSRVIVGSGLIVAAIVAVGLNLMMRIGLRQTATLVLERADEGRRAAEFLEKSGKAWGARQEVAIRAGLASGEALEALRETGVEGPVTLSVRFDEFSLRCTLTYAGEPLALNRPAAVDARAMLDKDDDELDAAMRQLSGVLIARLADRLHSGKRGDAAELTLTFEH